MFHVKQSRWSPHRDGLPSSLTEFPTDHVSRSSQPQHRTSSVGPRRRRFRVARGQILRRPEIPPHDHDVPHSLGSTQRDGLRSREVGHLPRPSGSIIVRLRWNRHIPTGSKRLIRVFSRANRRSLWILDVSRETILAGVGDDTADDTRRGVRHRTSHPMSPRDTGLMSDRTLVVVGPFLGHR